MARRLGRHWAGIVAQAKTIIAGYDTPVTLRQCFYRLVAAGVLRNHIRDYAELSKLTAEVRRAETFPRFLDRTRGIHRYQTFPSPTGAWRWLADIYRRDRTEGQPVALYLGVEKHGLLEQLAAWFGDLGLPIITLGGYSSQTQKDEVADDLAADLARQDRSSVFLYAGDFDPSDEDISRDFIARVGASVHSPTAFTEVRRIALSPAQVEQYDLPEDVGKVTDSRAPGFVARHGKLVQGKLDALPPDVLRQLFADATSEYWDDTAHQAVLEREEAERAVLRRRGGRTR